MKTNGWLSVSTTPPPRDGWVHVWHQGRIALGKYCPQFPVPGVHDWLLLAPGCSPHAPFPAYHPKWWRPQPVGEKLEVERAAKPRIAELESRLTEAAALATAALRLVLVFEDLGTWDASTPAEEIFRKAAETALRRVRELADSENVQVVGEPVVEAVIARGST